MMRRVENVGLCSWWVRTVAVVVALMASTGRVRADTIDTTPAWDKQTYVALFGSPSTATYGQTITAPAGSTSLNSFSFAMNLPSTVQFRGEVFAWDGAKAIGSSLFESQTRSTTGSGNFQTISFNTNGVPVTPGQKYVLFASVSKDFATSSDFGSWGFVGGDPYAGGNFVYLDNGGDTSQWTSKPWQTLNGASSADLAFTASFTPNSGSANTPEPGSLTLAGIGLGGIVGWAWRRRRAARS